MVENLTGYELCEWNWQKIRAIETIGEHLNEVQRWLEAAESFDDNLVDAVHSSAAAAGKLLAYLIVIQQHLLDNL